LFRASGMTAVRLARISLPVADAGALAAFYQDALGFVHVGTEDRTEAIGAAQATLLRLGKETVELVAFSPPGAPYPVGSASNDLWFQHFAIVVGDMGAAFARLRARPGWASISTAGPQILPASSGGVTAFKFRDPEGHPLELLAFPPDKAPPRWQGAAAAGPCLGIDHSAIAVADTEASVAFYRRLGFAVAGRSLNQGAEQERLDDVPGAIVEVTALALPGAAGPHVELLCYRRPRGRPAPPMRGNDVAKTCMVFDAEQALRLRDPDGHDLVLRPG
jgi:catechol 2,3-dioxygenase-like lactoylglutathione lyase family enzyme